MRRQSGSTHGASVGAPPDSKEIAMRLTRLAPLAMSSLLFACSPEPEPAPDQAPARAALASRSPDVGLGEHVTVLTRNLYLGADINRIAAAQTPQDVPLIAGAIWATVQMTDFPARAKLIADEIEAARPDLVALEEASLFRTGPGLSCLGQNVPATTVAIDFLAILQAELTDRHLHYDLASSIDNFDAQLCAFDGAAFLDVRLTDRDAILVRRGVATRNVLSGTFAAKALYPAAGSALPAPRGWSSVEVGSRHGWFRFAMTHLEQELFATVQEAQARELVGILAGGPMPVILAGDFNAGPELEAITTSYPDLLAAGYRDPWPRLQRRHPGPTCCFDEALLTGVLRTRIDLTLYRGAVRPQATWRIGLADRTATGLHASDHAGLVTIFQLRRDERRGD
jgi:endonuclease/exonuclease/phosphatase (EEP) superfamily protein YafD